MGTNPLLHAIFKDRYFSHDEVLNAKRDFDPTFTWRSICGSKSLLLGGLGWRIGIGWAINAINNKWLMIDGKPTTPTLRHDEGVDLQVGDLINVEDWLWNIEKLRELFNSAFVEGARAIPLVRDSGSDRFFFGIQ